MSVKTVEFNLTRVYAKLGLRSRTELAARAGTDGSLDARARRQAVQRVHR